MRKEESFDRVIVQKTAHQDRTFDTTTSYGKLSILVSLERRHGSHAWMKSGMKLSGPVRE
jgi:hypothetical protein